jgi:hypothetical protein
MISSIIIHYLHLQAWGSFGPLVQNGISRQAPQGGILPTTSFRTTTAQVRDADYTTKWTVPGSLAKWRLLRQKNGGNVGTPLNGDHLLICAALGRRDIRQCASFDGRFENFGNIAF